MRGSGRRKLGRAGAQSDDHAAGGELVLPRETAPSFPLPDAGEDEGRPTEADMRRLSEERRLVEAAQIGDEAALEALYRSHYDRVYRYVLLRVGSVSAAEDVSSAVFLGMLKGLPRFRWQGRPFVAWLYAIAQKQVAYHHRCCGREPAALELEGADQAVAESLGPEATVAEQERRIRLTRALRMLPDSQREVVLLRCVLGLSLAETASAVDRSEGAIKQLQLRGLATLKDILGGPEPA